MVIRVLDVAGAADTQEQGAMVYSHLLDALAVHGEIRVSFAGIDIATSSFVNTSFLRLLDSMSLDDIKARVRVVNSNRQINTMIKKGLQTGRLATV